MSHMSHGEFRVFPDGAQPAGEAKFDRYAQCYEAEVNRSLGLLQGKADYFTRVKADYLLDLVSAHFGGTDHVALLDVGCGTGNLHPLISPVLGSVTGADISRVSLDRAAARNPGNRYLHYDGERLPFADDSFDAATAVCVMHHVPPAQWPQFCAEMHRVLKPGGFALVFEHNPLNPLTRRVVANCKFDDDAVLLGQGQLRGLLGDAGFSQATSRAILSIPSFGRATRAVDRVLGLLPLGAQYYVQAQA
jgi:SAM-dependent methyltransferase